MFLEREENVKGILDKTEEAVKAAFSLCGYDPELGRVTVSNRPDLCEYQSNGAMAGAKRYHKNPMEIAEELAERLREQGNTEGPIFRRVEAVRPGFLNLDLGEAFLSGYLNEMNAKEKLGLDPKEGKRIIVDYGGANVAKPLHVGHLRSAVIGEALKRLALRMGNRAIGDVHLGDWGLQMGLIIAELSDRGLSCEDLTLSELEEIYPAASKKAKEKDANGELLNPDFAKRAHEATKNLQSGDKACRRIWEKIMELSKADLKKNYDALDVHFELWKGESDAEPYIPGLIEELVRKGLAYESQGALVVDIAEPGDKKELPPCMIRKSDGASLYATSDLGTILDREKNFHPDRYIYIADSRQSLHYTQFFRVAKKAGFVPPDTELDYIGFGTMNGKDGRPFKTREGGVLRLELLIRDTRESVLARIRASRGEEMSGREAEETADVVALAALKYGDLQNQATRDYVFDLEKFTAFEGNTGPYILYTIVRIASILRKYAEAKGMEFHGAEDWIREHGSEFEIRIMEEKSGYELQLSLARFQDEMKAAWKELAPHKICSYIYKLSNDFNSFYHEVKILAEPDEEKKKSRLATLILSWKILNDCIHTLGFSAPERM